MRRGLRQPQPLVLTEDRFEFRPAFFIERLEGVEIDRDHSGIVLLEERLDGLLEIRLRRARGHFFDRAVFVVLDFQRVEEVAKDLLVFADEPDLQEVRGDAVALLFAEHILEPGVALIAWLPFNEDRTKLPLFRERIDGRLIERLFLFREEGKQFRRRLRRHTGKDFVRFQHKGNGGQ